MTVDDPFLVRTRAELVATLVDATWGDEQELHRAARAHRADLDSEWTVIVVTAREAKSPLAPLKSAAVWLGALLPSALVGMPRALPTKHFPVIVQGTEQSSVSAVVEVAARIIAEETLIGIVAEEPVPWRALPKVYRRHVDGIAPLRALQACAGLIRERECATYRLLQSLPVAERGRYVGEVLAPIYRQRRSADLLAALEAYFEHGGRLRDAAAAVGMHRNSLRYRIQRAQALLGADIRSEPDRMRIDLALALRRLDSEMLASLKAGDSES